MSSESYWYDAFISYRHLERDIKIVSTIQKLLENYRSPCDGVYIKNGERIRRLFTDRSELPLNPSLGESIHTALAESRFLIVIASPEYMQSDWCMEELRVFLKLNNGSTDRILFVRVGGEPSCVTDILSAADVRTEDDDFNEPLYIEASTLPLRNQLRTVRREHIRIAAALIGCGYDQLYQRHKRQKKRKRLIFSVLLLFFAAGIGLLFKSEYDQRIRIGHYRAMDNAIAAIHTTLDNHDAVGALFVMQDVSRQYAQHPEYFAYLAEKLESAALSASYIPAFSPFASEPLPTAQSRICPSSDGAFVIGYDIESLREEGEIKVFLYDAYLRKRSEHVLSVGDWNRELLPGIISGNFRMDFDSVKNTFTLELRADDSQSNQEVLGESRTYAADGKLLDVRMLNAADEARTSAEVRMLYDALTTDDDRPFCMGAEGVYCIITGEDGAFEPYGAKDDLYYLAYIPASGDSMFYLTELRRSSNIHSIERISITPDNRYIIVTESQGVYNDVLTLCHTANAHEPVVIDLGRRTVSSMLYQAVPESQDAKLFLKLHISDKDDASLIVAFHISDGSISHCEQYETASTYGMYLSKQGYLYLTGNSSMQVISTENMCLPDRLAGIDPDTPARTDLTDNELIENPDSFRYDSTGGMCNVSVGNLILSPDATQLHHVTPDDYTGCNIGITVQEQSGDSIVQFFSADFLHPYYCARDNVFGLINYDEPEHSQLFRLYDFHEVIALLED